MSLLPGTRLGTYEIVTSLGAGGMGEVYRARDLRLGREVAIKILPADVARHPERLARFEREARTVAGLNHPNIVVLYSIEDEDEVRFITMELVEGRSLEQLVAPGGLPLARVIELGIAMADALAAAHEKGVVHRDFKPANVMLTREERIKVLDFGLAKLAEPESNSRLDAAEAATMAPPLTGAGMVVGTVPYMAPEQIRGEAVDARTDLFALGVVIYELAAGRRPFGGATWADVSSAILRDPAPRLAALRADLPVDLDRIVGRCLEKQPRERAQSALDVSNDLQRLRRDLERRDSEAAAKSSSRQVASIAVLPFVNRSRDEDDEYFADGLADELLNVLSKIKGLRVTARSSSFHFKGRNATIAEVGSALNVATVLEGSVRKAANRVRISVQLVNVADSSHLWSESYDRTLDDIFAVQDDIAQSVVTELRTALLGEAMAPGASGEAKAEVAEAAKGRGTDPEAYRIYLLAQGLLNRLGRQDTATAIEYLDQALVLDPGFALAWAELSQAHTLRACAGWVPVADGLGPAREAAERALLLEPDLAEGHTALAFIRINLSWDWRGAEASIARALELAPGAPIVLRRAALLARINGRLEEAVELFRRALEIDPLSVGAHSNFGVLLNDMNRFAEAEKLQRTGLALAPQATAVHAYLAMTLLAQGRSDEALAEAMQESDEAFRPWAISIIRHETGHSAESDEALRELIETCANDSAAQIAQVHAIRGEVDAAFEWLERAYVQRDTGLTHVKSAPAYRLLHDDPRWARFLVKMGLER